MWSWGSYCRNVYDCSFLGGYKKEGILTLHWLLKGALVLVLFCYQFTSTEQGSSGLVGSLDWQRWSVSTKSQAVDFVVRLRPFLKRFEVNCSAERKMVRTPVTNSIPYNLFWLVTCFCWARSFCAKQLALLQSFRKSVLWRPNIYAYFSRKVCVNKNSYS